MPSFTVAGHRFNIDHREVERLMAHELPEPLLSHYVVIGGRRFPPKQVLSTLTSLDRADFTTHQARRLLIRLGFSAARVPAPHAAASPAEPQAGPYGGAQAKALAPYRGQWVALASPTEILVAADSPQEVIGWLSRHGRRADFGMFRVPQADSEAGGAAPA